MIRGYSLASGSDYYEINWNQPRFLPERYQVTCWYNCTMKATSGFKYGMKNYVIISQHYLSSVATSFRISNPHMRSSWMLILLAVYNQASIDSGIAIAKTSLAEDKCKKSSALGDFIHEITLGYLYAYNFIFVYAKPKQKLMTKSRTKSMQHYWDGLGVWTEIKG